MAAAALALLIGALLTEAMVLVPMWRSLSPQEFFALHAAHAHRLYAFFAPLTASAALLSVTSAVATVATGRAGRLPSVLAAALVLVILSTYALYFRRANASFAEARITDHDLPHELARWARWHWCRTIIGLIALAASLLALRGAG
jgi:Domain of unknown function (DUF1772)